MEEIYGVVKNDFEDLSSAERRRKIYRVETFIIPGKIRTDMIFRSTEELDLDFRHDEEEEEVEKEDEDPEDKKKENAEGVEIGTLEFPQISANPTANDVVEFVSLNYEENSVPKAAVESAKESLCSIDGHDFEEGSCGQSPADRFKRNYYSEGGDSFLGFDCTMNFQGEPAIPNIERSQSFDFLPSLKPSSDLKSIKESCEVSYGSCEELCHHGNKNGCTVAAQSPSQVSEEIFKEHWMQRLEFLRRRVSLIREKEVALQERERLLMKKEKELRILERLVREKVQRADLYLKRCTIRNSANLDDDDLPPNIFLCELSRPSPPPYPEKPQINGSESSNLDADSRDMSAGSRTSNRSKGSSANSIRSGSSRGEKSAIRDIKPSRENGTTRPLDSLKNFGPSETAAGSMNSCLNNVNSKTSLEIARSLEGSKDFRRSKWSAYSSWRCRVKPKLSYDDLDSTLSADIGDSSFLPVTSKKLDPRLVRKPRGFSRSASERGPKNRPCSLNLDVDLGPDGERVLRKISENISAISQSQGARFQDYGSIDKRHKSEPKIDDLVLEKPIPTQSFGNRSNGNRIDQAKSVAEKEHQLKTRKERTSFWNEEASDWLRKKRQAYNLATKRIPNKDYENNKENLGNSKNLEKHSRSKNEKGKKFTIFR